MKLLHTVTGPIRRDNHDKTTLLHSEYRIFNKDLFYKYFGDQ